MTVVSAVVAIAVVAVPVLVLILLPRRRGDRHPFRRMVLHPLDPQLPPVVHLELVPDHRDTAQVRGDQPGEGLVRPSGHRQPERAQLMNAHDTVHAPAPPPVDLLQFDHLAVALRVVLVPDLAHDLLEHVLDGHHAGHPAIFVEHHGQARLAAYAFEQDVGRQGFGHQQRV